MQKYAEYSCRNAEKPLTVIQKLTKKNKSFTKNFKAKEQNFVFVTNMNVVYPSKHFPDNTITCRH